MNKRKFFDSSQMTREVALLYETALVADVSARAVAEKIGVSFPTVYDWYSGQTKPLARHIPKIIEVTRELEPAAREHEKAGAWYSSPGSAEDGDPAYEIEMAVHRELRDLFASATREIRSQSEWKVLKESWPGFAEVVIFLRTRGLKFEV